MSTFPHEPLSADAASSLGARADAYAEACFAEARRDVHVSPAARVEALDALQHSRRVAALMRAVAAAFGEDVERFAAAGVLHDIGKVALGADGRRHILDTIAQPGGLTPNDRHLVNQHGPLGADQIDGKFDEDIAAATARHCTYEAEELTFLELALQAADIYDALRSSRVYKEGDRHAAALIKMMDQAPGVTDELLIFFALTADKVWAEAWEQAPGMYGAVPVQLSAGMAAA